MVETQLFQIIRHQTNNEPVTCDIDWPRVWSLAKKHGLGQFVSAYMNQIPAEHKPEGKLQSAIARYNALMLVYQINQDVAVKDIHSALEAKECYHLFMKGIVTKHRYKASVQRSVLSVNGRY